MQNFNITKCANVDFYLKRGDTFYFNFQVQYDDIGINLAAYNSAKMQLRENELADPAITFSSSGGTIGIDYLSSGQIIINANTSSIPANTYLYDLELSDTNNNIKETVMNGKIFVDSDYTI